MRHDEGDRRNAGWIARVAFACGAILLIPGAGQAPQAKPDELPEVFPSEVKADSKTTSDLKNAEDLKKAEQELKRAEEMFEKNSIGKVRLEEARRKLLELKVSALEEEFLRGKIRLARSYFARTEERVDVARNTEKQAEYTKTWQTHEQLTLVQARIGLEQAESNLLVYLRYTKPKMERAEKALDEGESAQRLALAARPNEGSAKATSSQAVEGTSSSKEVKSGWQKLAESRLEQRITAIRYELSPARLRIKQHEDEVDYTAKLRDAGFVSESEVKKEKLALQSIKDFLTVMRGKLEGLRQPPLNFNEVKAVKNNAKSVDLPMEAAKEITLKGVAREKGTDKPIEGVKVSFGAGFSLLGPPSVMTDKNGRYEFVELPEAEEYSVVVDPTMQNELYFVTTARARPANKGEKTVTCDLDVTRGIPYRVRVLDKSTGRPLLNPKNGNPLNGIISYFPVTPNDPYKREVWRDSKAQETGTVSGSFNESGGVDEDGEYRGVVLPGPGVLCFKTYLTRNLKKADHKPSFFFPDGKDAVRILSQEKPPVSAIMVPIRGSSSSLGIGLKQYAAVIAINPKEDAKEVSYEIRVDQRDAQK